VKVIITLQPMVKPFEAAAMKLAGESVRYKVFHFSMLPVVLLDRWKLQKTNENPDVPATA